MYILQDVQLKATQVQVDLSHKTSENRKRHCDSSKGFKPFESAAIKGRIAAGIEYCHLFLDTFGCTGINTIAHLPSFHC